MFYRCRYCSTCFCFWGLRLCLSARHLAVLDSHFFKLRRTIVDYGQLIHNGIMHGQCCLELTKVLHVGGDSAGGNLSAVVAQQLKGTPHSPKAQLLIYPVTDNATHYKSYDQYGADMPLTMQDVRTFEYYYVHSGSLKLGNPLTAPMRGDATGVCPAFVVTAEMDVLVDEGEAYAHKLRREGVKVVSKRVYGQPHGFINMVGIHKGAKLELIKFAQEFAGFVKAL